MSVSGVASPRNHKKPCNSVGLRGIENEFKVLLAYHPGFQAVFGPLVCSCLATVA